ncbi:MAG: hypothetical protein ACREAM_30920 [Blastocatellia bacterium]
MTRMIKLKTRSIYRGVSGILAMGMILAMPVSGKMATRISAPRGKHILMDGKLGEEEWADARRIATSDSIAIYLKRDAGYLYVAIQTAGQASSVDLYLDMTSYPKATGCEQPKLPFNLAT